MMAFHHQIYHLLKSGRLPDMFPRPGLWDLTKEYMCGPSLLQLVEFHAVKRVSVPFHANVPLETQDLKFKI